MKLLIYLLTKRGREREKGRGKGRTRREGRRRVKRTERKSNRRQKSPKIVDYLNVYILGKYFLPGPETPLT